MIRDKFKVTHEVWVNPEKTWGVWKVKSLDKGHVYKMTGNIQKAHFGKGSVLNIEGILFHHPKYGETLKMLKYEVALSDKRKDYEQIEEQMRVSSLKFFFKERIYQVGEVRSENLTKTGVFHLLELLENGDIKKIKEHGRVSEKIASSIVAQYHEMKNRYIKVPIVFKMMLLGFSDENIIQVLKAIFLHVSSYTQLNISEKEIKLALDSESLEFVLKILILSEEDTFIERFNKTALNIFNAEEGSSYYTWMTKKTSISFNRIDRAWFTLGGKLDHKDRLLSISFNTLRDLCSASGGSGVKQNEFLNKFCQKAYLEYGDAFQWVNSMEKSEESPFFKEGDIIYFKHLVFQEKEISDNIRLLNSHKLMKEEEAERVLEVVHKRIQRKERKEICLTDKQKEAVINALVNPVFILTGGPGCGKTFSLKFIVEALRYLGLEVQLVAPTGKAARRVGEMSEVEGSTIHKAFGIDLSQDDRLVALKKPGGDAIIIDEASMVDISLFNAMLNAVVESCGTGGTKRLIIVGDKDQLPSVGPGNVLNDLIASGIPTVFLDKIFRQGSDAYGIIKNAQRIKNSQIPQDMTEEGFEIIEPSGEKEKHTASIMQIIRKKALEVKEREETLLVLSPMKKRGAGTEKINKMLKEIYNPSPEKTVHITEAGRAYSDMNMIMKDKEKENLKTFSVGDRVIQTKNNYRMKKCVENDLPDKASFSLMNTHFPIKHSPYRVTEDLIGVMNGEMGEIIHIDEKGLVVNFNKGLKDEKMVFMKFVTAYRYIEHAWAITVHKSQGSQEKNIIMVIDRPHIFFCGKKILYTGITRAEKNCILIASQKSIKSALLNKTEERITKLKYFLSN